VERQQIGEQFRIFEPARVPERPFSPNRGRLYLMSMALAILVGLGTAGVFEYLDRGLRSEDDVRLALALPVLATIPVIGPAQKASFRRRIVGSAVALALTVGLGATWLVLR
jgi:capsular polysaccharide biosynthesis protein